MTYMTWPHDNVFLSYSTFMTSYAFDTDIVKVSDSDNDYDFDNDHDNFDTDFVFLTYDQILFF